MGVSQNLFLFFDTFVQSYRTFSDLAVQFVRLRNLSSACCGPGLLLALECQVSVLSELSSCENVHMRETHTSRCLRALAHLLCRSSREEHERAFSSAVGARGGSLQTVHFGKREGVAVTLGTSGEGSAGGGAGLGESCWQVPVSERGCSTGMAILASALVADSRGKA